jgi:hypothetical protein
MVVASQTASNEQCGLGSQGQAYAGKISSKFERVDGRRPGLVASSGEGRDEMRREEAHGDIREVILNGQSSVEEGRIRRRRG